MTLKARKHYRSGHLNLKSFEGAFITENVSIIILSHFHPLACEEMRRFEEIKRELVERLRLAEEERLAEEVKAAEEARVAEEVTTE
jgi:hypothetical protein